MLIELKIPKTVQWLLQIFLLYFFVFTIFRFITFCLYKPADVSFIQCLPAFGLGISYDCRWIAFALIPISVCSFHKKLTPFYSKRMQQVWIIYLALATLIMLFLFGADFGQFSYVNSRLNADALNFAEDPRESFLMIWQTYPVIWILLLLAFTIYVLVKIFKYIKVEVEEQNQNIHKFFYRRIWHLVFFIFLLICVRGLFTLRTLRWDRAFSFKQEFISNLALNPMQNFFTTLRFRKPIFNTAASNYKSDIHQFLNINNELNENPYARIVIPNKPSQTESQPNVVLVICESFSMYKSSMSGNPLNTTPYFNSLCKEGLFFDRCFTPHFGTARGVFALLTGIPDVQLAKFSSRIEESLDHYTIINSFKNYDKFYFLGGRSEFNNFKGMFNNIDSLKIFDESNINLPKKNVWGASDKDLFLKANQIFAQQKRPFFGIIQTADNHRPFDIVDKDNEFQKLKQEKDTLKKYGFDSEEEYNAFRYMDFAIEKFMNEAKKQAYFNNTIFVFIGDHGVEGNSQNIYPNAWQNQRLTDVHVPLLFYAPKLIQPQTLKNTVSQIDVLPTIAGLSGISYLNTTLGRDLLDSTTQKNPAAFIIYHAAFWTGILNNDNYFRQHLQTKNQEYVSIKNNNILKLLENNDEINKSKNLTNAIYQTALWMLVNNKKHKVKPLLDKL